MVGFCYFAIVATKFNAAIVVLSDSVTVSVALVVSNVVCAHVSVNSFSYIIIPDVIIPLSTTSAAIADASAVIASDVLFKTLTLFSL